MKKLGFGFMRLPLKSQDDQSSIDMDELTRMVDSYLGRGFNYFDTAYMYHMSKSETALREVLVKRHKRDSFRVATKLPTMILQKEGDQERIFSEQLEKCGLEYFDYYLLHNLGEVNYETAEKFNSFGFISEMKSKGKVKEIGFSYHDNADLLDKILTEHPEVDFVQLQINYLDWNSSSIQSGRCYDVARKHKKPVIVMEPVKGGILANLPEKAVQLFREHNKDMSVTSWAIRYAVSLDGVMMVLSGMSNLKQLEDNMSFMDEFKPLNQGDYSVIEKVVTIINEAIEIPCTACQYCVDICPQDIAIPEYFSLYNTKKQSTPRGYIVLNVYYNNYIKTRGKASDCIECKACEEFCPQHIEITEWLKKVADSFEN